MTFWGGSGSESGFADPCIVLMDPDPAIFVIDCPKMPTKTNYLKSFFAYYFLEVHVHHQKKSQSSRNQDFSYFFCLVIQTRIRIHTSDWSRRPKNMWIRIRNTANNPRVLHMGFGQREGTQPPSPPLFLSQVVKWYGELASPAPPHPPPAPPRAGGVVVFLVY